MTITPTKTYEPPSETEPASWKQMRYLRTLVNDRDVNFSVPPRGLTEAQASDLIDRALTFPRRIPDLVEPGFYLLQGELYRVRARLSGPGTYAEWWRLKDGRRTWRFVPGAVTDLRGTAPITDEAAAAYISEAQA